MKIAAYCSALILALLTLPLTVSPVSASTPTCTKSGCHAVAKRIVKKSGTRARPSSSTTSSRQSRRVDGSSAVKGGSQPKLYQKKSTSSSSKARQANNKRMNIYRAAMITRRTCQGTGPPGICAMLTAPPVNEPAAPNYIVPVDRIGVAERSSIVPVAVSPQQAAYIAFARLKLTAPTPGIGPSPSLNPWKMAAVGYPLWLWAEGNTNPAPVSDTAGGLFVSLDANLDKIVYDMGDGTQLTCAGTGTPWGSWVNPGQASPTCGHTYQKPSLPAGNYTVTATTHWSVAWTVTGQTGTIPFVQSAQTTIAVGELQVLVR